MNPHHLLVATLALLIVELIDDAQSTPTLSVNPFDDVDMSLLHRSMRQGNDCDTQVGLYII